MNKTPNSTLTRVPWDGSSFLSIECCEVFYCPLSLVNASGGTSDWYAQHKKKHASWGSHSQIGIWWWQAPLNSLQQIILCRSSAFLMATYQFQWEAKNTIICINFLLEKVKIWDKGVLILGLHTNTAAYLVNLWNKSESNFNFVFFIIVRSCESFR